MPTKPQVKEHASPSPPTIYSLLGGKLGIPRVQSEADLVRLVQNQLPVTAIQALIRDGLSEAEVYDLVVPRRTLSHRLAKQQPLSKAESERAIRVARTTALAERAFGDSDKAWRWLRKPSRRLGGKTPLEMAALEIGARVIEEMLIQFEYGMTA